jgi:hypothetical protein
MGGFFIRSTLRLYGDKVPLMVRPSEAYLFFGCPVDTAFSSHVPLYLFKAQVYVSRTFLMQFTFGQMAFGHVVCIVGTFSF